jgi:hypothetical protein
MQININANKIFTQFSSYLTNILTGHCLNDSGKGRFYPVLDRYSMLGVS